MWTRRFSMVGDKGGQCMCCLTKLDKILWTSYEIPIHPLHSCLAYWWTIGWLPLTDASSCFTVKIPFTDTGPTGCIFIKLPSKIRLHSDNKLVDVKIQYTKSLPLFIASHFSSYHPREKINNNTTAVLTTENFWVFFFNDAIFIYI